MTRRSWGGPRTPLPLDRRDRHQNPRWRGRDQGDERRRAGGRRLGQYAQSDAFLWSSATGVKNLGTLPAPYNTGSRADGINLSGQIVGTSWDLIRCPGTSSTSAFLYSNGTMEDLNNLTSLPAG